MTKLLWEGPRLFTKHSAVILQCYVGYLGAARWVGKGSYAGRLGQEKTDIILGVSGSERVGSIAPDNSSLVTG